MLKGKTDRSNQEFVGERCPLCQVPLCLLAEGSQHQHVLTCINVCHAGLPGLIFLSEFFIEQNQDKSLSLWTETARHFVWLFIGREPCGCIREM